MRSTLGGARGVARGMSTLTPRARIVLIEHGRVALIRRDRDGQTDFFFPGGGVEAGETPEEAARREAVEKLGVEVELGRSRTRSPSAARSSSTTTPGSSAEASAREAGRITRR